jgi:tetratricopeptide (TPR) repeat protein
MRFLTPARAATCAAALWLALACAPAGAALPGVFYVDGMAVDALPSALPGEGSFRSGLAGLADPPEQVLRSINVPLMQEPRRSPADLEQADRHLARAEQHLRAGDFPKAMLEVRDGLALNPNHPGLLNRAAILAANLREFNRAEFYFRRYLEMNPNDLYHLSAYAAVLIRLTRLDEADRALDSASAINPDYMPARFNRACLDLIRDRPDRDPGYWLRRSVEEVEIVTRWLESDRAELIRVMGDEGFRSLAALTLGPRVDPAGFAPFAQALLDLREALTRDDADTAGARLVLLRQAGYHTVFLDIVRSDLAVARGDAPAALAVWADIVARQPAWAYARLRLGQALIHSGQYAQAVEVLKEARRLARNDGLARFVLACAHALNGNRVEAGELFNAVAMEFPKQFQPWLDSDPRFQEALARMPNWQALLRRAGIPPESEDIEP